MDNLEAWILFGILGVAYLALGVLALRGPHGPDPLDCPSDCRFCKEDRERAEAEERA